MNKKRSSGFTLFEVVIVIAILAVLAAIVIPDFFPFKKNSDLDNGVQEFVSVLRLAQNKTLSSEGNSQYGVYIDTGASPNQYILFKGASYASRIVSADQVYALQEMLEFYNISLGGGNEIVFDRLTGSSQETGSVSARIKSDMDKNKTVYILSSGVVSFSPSSGSLDVNRVKDSRHIQLDYSRNINTADESITLTFDNSLTRTIPINSYLVAGQLQWQDTVSVGGEDQTVEINTLYLNDSVKGTVFSIHRDRRYNSKSLKITISGDSSGYPAQYSADGLTVDHTSIYVSNFSWQ